MKKVIPYGRQAIAFKDIQAVIKVLKSDWLTQGPTVRAFEQKLCQYTGCQFCVVVSSATAALHLACLVCDLKPKDEVITSTNTFVASANCAVYAGAKPVLADIDLEFYNLTDASVALRISNKTRIVIPVHFAGQSCDMQKIKRLVDQKATEYGRKIYVIEDASHAVGSNYLKTKVGSGAYADMTVFSFHPVKNMTTGEGGAILTNDQQLYKRLKSLRMHGIVNEPNDLLYLEDHRPVIKKDEPYPWYYEQQSLGFNYRLTDIHSALGISQLTQLESFKKRRRQVVEQYNRAFQNIPWLKTPRLFDKGDPNFHLYVVLINWEALKISRGQVMMHLRQKGIYTQVHYIPVHTQPFYRQRFKTRWGDCPNAETYYQQCLSLPLFPKMTTPEVKYVIEQVKALENIK